MRREKNILVACCDSSDKDIEFTFELLGKARRMAEIYGDCVIAYYAGKKNNAFFSKLFIHGAHKIVMHEINDDLEYRVVSHALKELINEHSPELVIMPNTSIYKAIASMVAIKVGAGLTADCVNIHEDNEGNYIFTRAAMGDSVIAEIVCINTAISMCTVKKNIFQNCIQEYPVLRPEIEVYKATADLVHKTFLYTLQKIQCENMEKNNLEKSRVIIALGRGVRKVDIGRIVKFAKKHNAEIGCTRVLVDQGMFSRSNQIGQSGITVAPDLYIAFGISGASQHMVGIQNAKTVVAVNHDNNASIFQYSDYGIVEDTHKIVECLDYLIAV